MQMVSVVRRLYELQCSFITMPPAFGGICELQLPQFAPEHGPVVASGAERVGSNPSSQTRPIAGAPSRHHPPRFASC
jgi:hypothetical protein